MLRNRICQAVPIAVLALAFVVTSPGIVAQEVCGVTSALFRDGFEDGALPPFSLPGSATPLTLAVTSPSNGATVGFDRVTLAGTYTGPPNTGVVVEGKVAGNSNTAWVSSPIVLTAGLNTIDVQLFTLDGPGPAITHNITFNPALGARVLLAPSQSSAMVPFTSRFVLTTKANETLAITRVALDYDGNGSIDIDTTNVALLTFAYRLPGLFEVSGTVTLDDTDPLTPPVLVPVTTQVLALHPQQTRFTVCSVFGAMRSRLAAQNVLGALNTLVPDLRPTFEPLWSSLGAQLPTIAGQLGTIFDGRMSLGETELMIARPITGQPGQSRVYRVQLVRDANGVWRIQAM